MQECVEILKALHAPDGLDPDLKIVGAAVENQGKGEGWQAYGVEVYTALQLAAASRVSIQTGAALVFC